MEKSGMKLPQQSDTVQNATIQALEVFPLDGAMSDMYIDIDEHVMN